MQGDKLIELASLFKDISMSENKEKQKKENLIKLLKKNSYCPLCKKEIKIRKENNYFTHIDDEHNRIGILPAIEKLEALMPQYATICFKIFTLKYFADLQAYRRPPGPKLEERYKKLIESIEKILESAISDLSD